MSGHSKWANIKLRKGAQDAKRGKVFTKAAKEIIIAAKNGGDPAGNARLRSAIAAAKAVNLPKDKIEAAIRKGTGQDAGGDLTEIMYEGYASGGVAVIVETATDNKNRTVADVRHIFTKHGGSLGESGSVAFQFDRKGVIMLSREKYPDEDESWGIYTSFEDFNSVREALEGQSVEMESAEINMVPKVTVPVDAETARKIMKLNDALEEHDDVQNVYFNFELPDDFEE